MLLSYREAEEEYGSQRLLELAVKDGKIYKVEPRVYSDHLHVPELAVIRMKYPNAILTGEYAFHHYGLLEKAPEKYDLATHSKAARIADPRIHQVYVRQDLLQIGAVDAVIDGVQVRIYDRERMLVELMRNKHSMPFPVYKEILRHYRSVVADLDLLRILEYMGVFPKSRMMRKILNEEVM